jgi:hypothetical protein
MRYLIAAIIFCLMSFGTAAPLLEGGNFFHPEALPTKEMRLAQQTLLGDGNVGLATQSNEAHYATLDTAITWKGARKYCKNLGYRLCHLKELCAGGEGSEPAGANELPNKQVFVAIKGPASNPKNVYAALTANAGDGVCTRKLNPDFAEQRADPPKGVTKSLVACCTTKFLQNRGKHRIRRLPLSSCTKITQRQKQRYILFLDVGVKLSVSAAVVLISRGSI